MSLVALLALVGASLFHRRLVGGLGQLVLLPGNLLHESAHAVATLLCGYTVVGFRLSLFGARGEVRPGPAWAPWARTWIANLIAPVAPLVAGIAVLAGLQAWSGAPGLPTSAAAVVPVLKLVPWQSPAFWVAVALAVPISAEMSPSDVDWRAWRVPAAVAALLAGAGAWALDRWQPGVALAWVQPLDGPTFHVFGRALSLLVWSTVVWGPVVWGVRGVR